jgi:hypothetical protein
MVGRGEFMDIHEAWVRGKSISEIADRLGERRALARFPHAKRNRHMLPHKFAARQWRGVDEPCPAREPLSDRAHQLEGQSGLTAATRAHQRQQPGLGQQSGSLS